jgi:hypothetical protein
MNKMTKRALDVATTALRAKKPKDFQKQIVAEAKRIGIDMNDADAMVDSGVMYGIRITEALHELVAVCHDMEKRPTKKLLDRYARCIANAEDVLANPFGETLPRRVQ